MKFMITWRVHEAARREALKTFSQMSTDDDRKDLGANVKLVGRWHDVTRFTGVAIAESDDAAAIHGWLLNWNHILDAEVSPVLDDEETRALGRKKLG